MISENLNATCKKAAVCSFVGSTASGADQQEIAGAVSHPPLRRSSTKTKKSNQGALKHVGQVYGASTAGGPVSNKQQQVMPFSNGGSANQTHSSQQQLLQTSSRNSLQGTGSFFQPAERGRTPLTLPIKRVAGSSKTGAIKGKSGNQMLLKASSCLP